MLKYIKTLLLIAIFCAAAWCMIKLSVATQRWMLGISDDRAYHHGKLGKCDLWEVEDGSKRIFIAYCGNKVETLEVKRK